MSEHPSIRQQADGDETAWASPWYTVAAVAIELPEYQASSKDWVTTNVLGQLSLPEV